MSGMVILGCLCARNVFFFVLHRVLFIQRHKRESESIIYGSQWKANFFVLLVIGSIYMMYKLQTNEECDTPGFSSSRG